MRFDSTVLWVLGRGWGTAFGDTIMASDPIHVFFLKPSRTTTGQVPRQQACSAAAPARPPSATISSFSIFADSLCHTSLSQLAFTFNSIKPQHGFSFPSLRDQSGLLHNFCCPSVCDQSGHLHRTFACLSVQTQCSSRLESNEQVFSAASRRVASCQLLPALHHGGSLQSESIRLSQAVPQAIARTPSEKRMQSTVYTRVETHRLGVECSQRTKDAGKLWLTSKHKAQRPFRGTPLQAVPIFNHCETLSRPGRLCRRS